MEKKPYSDRRWTDVPSYEIVDCPPPDKEEIKRRKKAVKEIFEKYGITKQNENLDNYKKL